MRPAQNRPDNTPFCETEEIKEFIGSAPELPAASLGGGLMRECVNMLISRDKLESRGKFKLWKGQDSLPHSLDVNSSPPFFFTVGFRNGQRMFWVTANGMGRATLNSDGYGAIGNLLPGEDVKDMLYRNLSDFRAFPFFGNLWVLSWKNNTPGASRWQSVVIENEYDVSARPLEFRKMAPPYSNYSIEAFAENKTARLFTFGVEYVAKNADGVDIRSSGIMLGRFYFYDSNRNIEEFTDKIGFAINFRSTLDIEMFIRNPDSFELWTHMNFWASDNLRESSSDTLSLHKIGSSTVAGITIDDSILIGNNFGAADKSFFGYRFDDLFPLGSELALADNIDCDPMHNALAYWNGRLWGIKDNKIIYSNYANSIYQELTNPLKVILDADIGSIYFLEALPGCVLAFGSGGIARITEDCKAYAVSNLSIGKTAKIAPLKSLGVAVFDKDRFLFVDENDLSASDKLFGIDIAGCLGPIMDSVTCCKYANGRIWIIGNRRLFMIDAEKRTGICEIRLVKVETLVPLSVEAASSGETLFVYSPPPGENGGFPVILSLESGAPFEEDARYFATFYQSARHGWAEHMDAVAVAKLREGMAIGTETICDGLLKTPLSLSLNGAARDADEYWDYRIPTNKSGGNRAVGKAVGVRVFAKPQSPSPENDGIEIRSVKLTRIKQGEAFSASFNPRAGRAELGVLATEFNEELLQEIDGEENFKKGLLQE